MANATSLSLDTPRRFTIGFNEILNFAYDSFCSNKLQFTLTALAMAVGTASVILVATIGLTGKQYMLRQLQSIGPNMIYADYQGGAQRIESTPDPILVEDVQAVREQVSSVVAASPTVALGDRIDVGGGKQSDILVLGVDPEYQQVRNLKVLAGRFFDSEDSAGRNKVGVITEKLAQRVYGSTPVPSARSSS
jgi:putative ABC transport system permease protein